MYEFSEQNIEFVEPKQIWEYRFKICLSSWLKRKQISLRQSTSLKSKEIRKDWYVPDAVGGSR